MINQIVTLAVKFRVMVVGAAAVVIAIAAAQLPMAPLQALPEFSPTQVQIQIEALGLSAAEVEQLITIPMEHLLGGVAWVDQIQSESVPGLSKIDLTFKPGTPLLKARQVVLERLGRADTLPNVGSPPVMIQPLSSESRVMMVGLNSTQLSLIDLSILARWKIKPRLMGIPGVANVAIWGFRDRQLQVQVDPDRLRKNGVTLSQIINSTGNALWVSPLTFIAASTPGTGGFIDTASQRFTIQHVLPITTASDLSTVIIDNTGNKIRLGQVTSVVEDHQPLIGDALMPDGNPGLMLVIQKFPGASTSDVTNAVQNAMNSMQAGMPNVAVDTTIYQSGVRAKGPDEPRTRSWRRAGAPPRGIAAVPFVARCCCRLRDHRPVTGRSSLRGLPHRFQPGPRDWFVQLEPPRAGRARHRTRRCCR
jgi:Cu/Ag efflux pump CusA